MKYFISFLLVAILLIPSSSFAGWFTKTKWLRPLFSYVTEKNREAYEKDAWKYAVFTIKEKMSKEDLAECGYHLSLPRPTTIALSAEEVQREYEKNKLPLKKIKQVAGFYRPSNKTVYYTKHRMGTLVHEYIHYINWNPIGSVQNNTLEKDKQYTVHRLINGQCLDEINGKLAAENYLLRRQVQHLTGRLNSR